MTDVHLTYAASGVDYDPIDRFKRMCQEAGPKTDVHLERLGFDVVRSSRGESAYVIERYASARAGERLAFVDEGLGTKELVARAMYDLTGRSYYRNIAQCSLAMIVNDIATLALPLTVSMHIATGSSAWFENETICRDLVEGYAAACDLARCAWGCGETPVLKGVIHENAALLSGAAVGIVPRRRISGTIKDGDAIVILGSSGIHANGLTLARTIAEGIPGGYLARMLDGRTYGETLLDATNIYSGFVEDCLSEGVPISYAVNITGHGWRKFMRAQGDFEYRIVSMPPCPLVFEFIAKHGPVDRREMFANFNMGAGFALYVPHDALSKIAEVHAAGKFPFSIQSCGMVIASDKKRVVIVPEGIDFEAGELQVR